MPLIVWAYPRGSAIADKGGKSSFYAVDYAARTASELGADMVKVNFPNPAKQARQSMEAGATGLIFGRNVWQRDQLESLRFVSALREILAKYPV